MCNGIKKLYSKYFKTNTPLQLTIVMGIVAIIFYFFNYYTPIFHDDFGYSLFCGTWDEINSVFDIIRSLYVHYFEVNGRMIVHFLSYVFLYIGKGIFNIINTVVFILLGLIIYYYSVSSNKEKRNKFCVKWLLTIYLLLYISTPDFGQSFLWLTGACNYMYGPLIVLVYFIFYKKYIDKQKDITCKRAMLFVIPAFLGGFIAGATNENTGSALIVMIILCIALSIYRHDRNWIWMSGGCIGSVIGVLSIVLSPGTQHRLDTTKGIGNMGDMSFRILNCTVNTVSYLKLIIIIFIVLLMIYIYQNREKSFKYNFEKLIPVMIYFIGMVASIYSMVLSPVFPKRVWSSIVMMALICLGNLAFVVDLNEKMVYRLTVIILIVGMTFYVLFSVYSEAYIVKNKYYENKSREDSIYEQISQGKTDVYAESMTGNSKCTVYTLSGDIGDDPYVNPNVYIAKYYGAKSITKHSD